VLWPHQWIMCWWVIIWWVTGKLWKLRIWDLTEKRGSLGMMSLETRSFLQPSLPQPPVHHEVSYQFYHMPPGWCSASPWAQKQWGQLTIAEISETMNQTKPFILLSWFSRVFDHNNGRLTNTVAVSC
jgi:hypothetical protein